MVFNKPLIFSISEFEKLCRRQSLIVCRGLVCRRPPDGAKLSAGGGSDVLATSSPARVNKISLKLTQSMNVREEQRFQIAVMQHCVAAGETRSLHSE
jgi:hypothetical protein